MRALAAAALTLSLALAPATAQRRAEQTTSETRPASAGVLSLLPANSVTEHTIDIRGEKLTYIATAGTFSLFDQNGEPSAAIFYTAYARKDAAVERRPVTFVFNGGPGAASAYLHLGVVGPQVAEFGEPPSGVDAKLRDNPDTWLAFTDLVLIDPVGAGWSRAAKSDKSGDFWSVRADAQSLAKVIALYVGKNGRTASPKYLLGESYGGFRAVKLARALQQEQGLTVSGIVMLSPFLEGALQFSGNRFALGAALQLPSLAAAELDRRNAFTPDALAAAERFAMTDYLVALAGRPPEGEAGRAFYSRVAALTGLPFDVVTRTRGLIREAYLKHVRDGRGEIVSAYDASAVSPDPYPESLSDSGPDPVLDGFTQALGGLFVGYAREQLGFKTDMTFNLLNREVAGKWDWGGSRGQASVSRDLRELLALTPQLRIFVAHGRSDVVTPYGVTRYVLDHLPPIGGPERTKLKLYRGGHMFYFVSEVRAAFNNDVRAFYRSAGL
jgi:carboxypeptidase C (cathepsin A)